MQVEKLRSLIRESIQEYIKEIDEAAETAAMEARIAKCDEAITSRETKLENLRNLEEAAGMLDEVKVKAMENEIKELKKAKLKFERLAEKRAAKLAGKGKEKKVTTDAKTEDAPVDESDVMEKMEMEGDMPKEEALNESFLKMQKLAGVITESQYNLKKKVLVENQLNEIDILGKLKNITSKFKDKLRKIKDAFDMKLSTAKKFIEDDINYGRITIDDGKEILDDKEFREKLKAIAGVGPLSNRVGSIETQEDQFYRSVAKLVDRYVDAKINEKRPKKTDSTSSTQKPMIVGDEGFVDWYDYCRGGRC